jgi:MraZ protein
MMLIGQYETTLSLKRRVAIPKAFRKVLGKKFIVAKWYEGCLVLVGQEDWQELLNRLTGKKGVITAPVRDTDRFILGSAFEVEPDGQGRVIIPSLLSEYANLKDDIVFIGLGDRVEIWSKADWKKRESYVASHAAEFVEKMAENEK